MKYVIQDKKTGNYVSERSIKPIGNNKWLYSSYTGWCAGMRTYPSENYAEKIITDLKREQIKFKGEYKFIVTEIEESSIKHGDYINIIIKK